MDVVIKIFKPIRRILFAVLVIDVGMIAMMMFLETSMVYPVPPRSSGEWNPDRLGHEEVDFRSADGTRLHGWFLEHPEPVATLLMCHGNGEHVAVLAEEMAFFSARLKVNVMVFDYRGYGKSEGTPFERGVLADAEAAQRVLFDHPRKPSISSSHLSELRQKFYCEAVKLKNNAQQQIDERSTN